MPNWEMWLISIITFSVIFLIGILRNKNGVVDNNGIIELRHGAVFRGFSIIPILFGVIFLVIGLVKGGIPKNFQDWVGFFLIILIFGGLAWVLVSESFFAKVYVDNKGITKQSFSASSIRIEWSEISSVTYSYLMNAYTITSSSKQKIRASSFMNGFQSLFDEIKRNRPDLVIPRHTSF